MGNVTNAADGVVGYGNMGHDYMNINQDANYGKAIFTLQDLAAGTTTFKDMRLYPGAHVSTPGATSTQAGHLYGAMTHDDTKAMQSGHMSVSNAEGGAFSAANGMFNRENGIEHNILVLL